MSAVIAPGVIPGLAPPTAEGPPSSTGSPVGGKTFAETVAAQSAVPEPAASAPDAPPGDHTAEIISDETTGLETADLAALIRELLTQTTGAPAEATADTVPLLDRPAGAGDTTDVHAMEALMAQTLLMRTPVDPEVTTAPVAAAAPAAVGSAASLDGSGATVLQQAVADLLAARGADATNGATPGVDGTFDAITQPGAEAQPALDVPQAAEIAPAAPEASSAVQAMKAMQAAAADQAQPGAPPSAVAPREAGAATTARFGATDAEDGPTDVTAPAAASAVVGTSTAGADEQSGGSEASDARTFRVVRRTGAEQGDATSALSASTPRASIESAAPAAGAPRLGGTPGAVTTQIANTVQTAVMRGEHEVRLVLNPPELGRVEIQITETTGGVRVHMVADQPGARDLIERQLPLLQQALSARDVRVERLEVGRPGESASAQSWSANSGSNDGQRQREQQDGGQPDWSPLAAMGLGITERARAERPRAVAAGSVDVLA